jgi:alcohol dehydrogenase (cytochrome c)
VAGQERTAIAVTGKDGLLRLLDRDTHELVYSVPFTTRGNTEGPIGKDFERIGPGTLGGHEWNGSACSPRLNTLFVPATDWCQEIRMSTTLPDPEEARTKGILFFGGETKSGSWDDARGWLTAFDVSIGKEIWKYDADKLMIGGVAATAGDLVFTGQLNGNFQAFDARDGRVLYTQNVGGLHSRRLNQLRLRRKTICCCSFRLRRHLQYGCP